MEADGVVHPADPGGKHHSGKLFRQVKADQKQGGREPRVKGGGDIFKGPDQQEGISNICSILRITTSTADEAKDDPRIRTDMIIPAVSRAFLAPMRLTMAGAQKHN